MIHPNPFVLPYCIFSFFASIKSQKIVKILICDLLPMQILIFIILYLTFSVIPDPLHFMYYFKIIILHANLLMETVF